MGAQVRLARYKGVLRAMKICYIFLDANWRNRTILAFSKIRIGRNIHHECNERQRD